jgi:signal transduction histidine kinase
MQKSSSSDKSLCAAIRFLLLPFRVPRSALRVAPDGSLSPVAGGAASAPLPARPSRLLRFASAWPAPLLSLALLGLVGVVGCIDYFTGLELSVSWLYLIPIALGTWIAGRSMGYTIALASVAVWFAADLLERHAYSHWYLPVWNSLTLAISFLVVASLLASLREANAGLEKTVAGRTQALQDENAQRRRAEEELRQALRETRDAHAELQQTQIQLIEAAKMESVARLAAGVAHEVKNPLTTLSLGADYFLNRNTKNPDELQLARDMKEAVRRARNVIDVLLDYARPSPLQLACEDLHSLIENALTLVRHQLARQHVAVARAFAPTLPALLLDRTRIEHLFVNLFLNALQAMEPGGILTLRTGLAAADPPRVFAEVCDTGPGVPPETADRLFEPFFTTKPPGQGTGLGLAIVRRIMEIHGGSIQLANRPDGPGACATLLFNPLINLVP